MGGRELKHYLVTSNKLNVKKFYNISKEHIYKYKYIYINIYICSNSYRYTFIRIFSLNLYGSVLHYHDA